MSNFIDFKDLSKTNDLSLNSDFHMNAKETYDNYTKFIGVNTNKLGKLIKFESSNL